MGDITERHQPMTSLSSRLRALGAVRVAIAALAVTIAFLVAAAPVGALAGPVDPPPPSKGVSAIARFVEAALREDAPVAVTPRAPAAAASGDVVATHCREAGDGDVPTVVAEIFRCRLERAGYAPDEVRQVAAEAVVVAQCESLWDPAAVVFDGRYLHQAHPRTGNRYSAAGVFQFIRATANDWIEGGYPYVFDAGRNIDAAARLYLHNRANGYRGWEDWACAAAHDGFKVGSVLPGWPGGPEALPAWAFEY